MADPQYAQVMEAIQTRGSHPHYSQYLAQQLSVHRTDKDLPFVLRQQAGHTFCLFLL